MTIYTNFAPSTDLPELAQRLAHAARVPLAVLGEARFGQGDIVSAHTGHRASRGTWTEDAMRREIALTLAASQEMAEAATGKGDGRLTQTVDGKDDDAILWMESDRCLIGTWYPAGRTAPFVALLREKPGAAFPRAQREIARLGLLLVRMRGVAGAAGAGMPQEPGLDAQVLTKTGIVALAIDGAGRIAFETPAARDWLAGQGDFLSVDKRLVARGSSGQQRLRQAVEAAARGTMRRPAVIAVGRRDDGRPSECVVVTPLDDRSGLALVLRGGTRVLMGLAEAFLAEMGLTPAERRLSLALIEGASIDEAAKRSGITISTARSYLKRVYAKTATNRQSQLVAVTAPLLPPLWGDGAGPVHMR